MNLPHSQAQCSRAFAVRPQARGQGRASAAPNRAPVQNSRGHRQSGRQPGDVVFYTDDLVVRHREQERGAENRARQLSFDEWRSPASAAFARAMAEMPHLPPHQRSSAAAGSGEIVGPPARLWVANDLFTHEAEEANWPAGGHQRRAAAARASGATAVPWATNDQFAREAEEANWPARATSGPAVPWRTNDPVATEGTETNRPATGDQQGSGRTRPSCSLGHQRSLLAERVGLDRGQYSSGSRQERRGAVRSWGSMGGRPASAPPDSCQRG